MDRTTFEVESQVEQTHWWFIGRRKLFKDHIMALELPLDAAILDIGTSTGTNLRLLKEMGFLNVGGLDLHEDAIRWCAEKGLGLVRKGDICDIPYPDASLDLILATDIIEHVEDDELALREISRVLKRSGHALITVPAFESLWGLQDTVSHHKRRYRKEELNRKLIRSGLIPVEVFYFNYLLFVPIWIARQVIRLVGIQLKSENQVNTSLINRILGAIFLTDVNYAKRIRSPFGVSVLALTAASAMPSCIAVATNVAEQV